MSTLREHVDSLQAAARRRRRRRAMGELTFALMGAGLGVLYAVSDDAHWLLAALAGAVGALIGWTLADRSGGRTPRALRAYARKHRLGTERNPLPAVTPLLLQPWGRTDGHVFGDHPSGLQGRIGVFNFVRPHRMYFNVAMRLLTRFWWPQSKGLHMLVALAEFPDSREVLPVLLCERRYGDKILDAPEEVARGLRRVRLESVELDSQYEIFAHPRQEPSWIRRLFSPSFIVWMSGERTQELSFEIFDGYLCVASPVRGSDEVSAEEIDRIGRLAAELSRRLRMELDETELARPPALYDKT